MKKIEAQDIVYLTVEEFAFLVRRRPDYICSMLRGGKLKGVRNVERSAWRIPDSELARFWGNLYGRLKGEHNG